LADIVGSKAYDIDLLKSQITQEVSRYIEKYIDIQTQQAQYQEVTDRESLYQLLSVEVTPDYNVDISYWTVSVMFQNRTGNTMLYEKKFEIPGPQNLLYGS
jgi:hypothetical protein